MNNKDYKDSIEMINDIISKTRDESKTLIESLEQLKRFYVWEYKIFTGEVKKSKKRINKWKKSRLIEKDVCFECNSKEGIQYHHVVPDSLGGNQTLPLCNECHGKIHDRKFVDVSFLIKETLKKKKEQGIVLGRRKGTGKTNIEILSNPNYKDAIDLIKSNRHSIRQIRNLVGLSTNTILKLSRILKSEKIIL